MRTIPWSSSTHPAIHYHFLFNTQKYLYQLTVPAHPATGAQQGHLDFPRDLEDVKKQILSNYKKEARI